MLHRCTKTYIVGKVLIGCRHLKDTPIDRMKIQAGSEQHAISLWLMHNSLNHLWTLSVKEV